MINHKGDKNKHNLGSYASWRKLEGLDILPNQCAASRVCLRCQCPQPSGWAGWGLGQAEPQIHSRHSCQYVKWMLLFPIYTVMWKNAGKHCSRSLGLECTMMWMNHLGISLKCRLRFSTSGSGLKNSLFSDKLRMLVQGPHLDLWASGDYICGPKILVFIRMTWGMWLKWCFLGSDL